MNPEKLLRQILAGQKSVRFQDFCQLVEAFGFRLDRVNGSHHIYKREGIPEFINLQNYKGEAKPYQIRQFLNLVEKYGLIMEGL
jgi:hypothetical protein